MVLKQQRDKEEKKRAINNAICVRSFWLFSHFPAFLLLHYLELSAIMEFDQYNSNERDWLCVLAKLSRSGKVQVYLFISQERQRMQSSSSMVERYQVWTVMTTAQTKQNKTKRKRHKEPLTFHYFISPF